MIYLIKSAGYGKDNNYIDLLKIGYTEDNKKDKRFLAYKLHNPTCKVLYEIPSLSEDIEKRIQYKFRSLKYKDYGNEWFYYSDDIVNFFRDIDKMDLESLPKSPKSEQRKYWKIEKMIKEVVSWISEITDKKKYIEKIIDDLGSNLNTVQDVLDYIVKDYGEDSISKYIEVIKKRETGIYCENDLINREVSEFLYKYEQLGTYFEKSKLLCESNLSKEVIELILAQISEEDDIKSHYIALGPQKLRALGYKATLIRRELGIVTFSKELLVNTILSKFSVGDRIVNSQLKETLRLLYFSISYTAVPKATDLNSYFEIKKCKISDGERRVDGLEIVGVKPEYQGTYNNLKIINS